MKQSLYVAICFLISMCEGAHASASCPHLLISDSVRVLYYGSREDNRPVIHSRVDSIVLNELGTRTIFLTDSTRFSKDKWTWMVDSSGDVRGAPTGQVSDAVWYKLCAQIGDMWMRDEQKVEFEGFGEYQLMDTTLVLMRFQYHVRNGDNWTKSALHLVSRDFGVVAEVDPITGGWSRELIGVSLLERVIGNPTVSVPPYRSSVSFDKCNVCWNSGSTVVLIPTSKATSSCVTTISVSSMIGTNIFSCERRTIQEQQTVDIPVSSSGLYFVTVHCQFHDTVCTDFFSMMK